MATQQSTVDYLEAQVVGAGKLRSRKMFGEYALYCDEKVVALICDDKFFVKPTMAGKAYASDAEEAPPYLGSKPFLLIEEDRWSDNEWMRELIRITAEELPIPKKKKPKKR